MEKFITLLLIHTRDIGHRNSRYGRFIEARIVQKNAACGKKADKKGGRIDNI
jgi:hypothetical protein